MKTLFNLLFGKNGYFFRIFLAQKFIYKKIIAGLIKRSPSYIACFLMSINSTKKINFGYEKKKKLYFVTENNLKHFFTNAFRGNWLYQRGLFERSFTLCQSYGIDKISFKTGDIIIDVGANYGDLGIYLRQFGVKIYGIEPDNDAFLALKENNYDQIYKCACSNRIGISKFYLNSQHADSSLIATNSNQNYANVETNTIDNLFKENEKIKLIKIEAEGFEPEIIRGSLSVLKKTEFICVDGGPERGQQKKQTIEEISNILFENNFEILFLNIKEAKALFSIKNKFN